MKKIVFFICSLALFIACKESDHSHTFILRDDLKSILPDSKLIIRDSVIGEVTEVTEVTDDVTNRKTYATVVLSDKRSLTDSAKFSVIPSLLQVDKFQFINVVPSANGKLLSESDTVYLSHRKSSFSLSDTAWIKDKLNTTLKILSDSVLNRK